MCRIAQMIGSNEPHKIFLISDTDFLLLPVYWEISIIFLNRCMSADYLSANSIVLPPIERLSIGTLLYITGENFLITSSNIFSDRISIYIL